MTGESQPRLPEGWRLERIGDIFESWGGSTPSKANSGYWGGDMPWVSSKDLKHPRLDATTHTVTQTAIEETGLRICPPGSVLVVMRSGILAHSLPVSVTEMPVTINQDLKAFFSTEPQLNEWLALFLRMSAHDLLASSRRDGTTVQSVQYPLLLKTLIPVPPLKQRPKIIATIETLLTKQAAVPPRLESARRLVERFRLAVLAAACSGTLTSGRRTERSLPTIELTSTAPAHWKSIRLAEVAERVTKGTTPTSYGDGFVDTGIPFIKVENLVNGEIDQPSIRFFVTEGTHQTQSRSALQAGDVLFSIAGTIGRTAIVHEEDVPANTNQALAIIRGTSHLLEAEYLVIALQSAVRLAAAQAARGSGMDNISLSDVRNFLVPVPPRGEQKAIVQAVTHLMHETDKILERVDSAAAGLDRVPRAVLAKAFRGDLVT